MSKLNITGTAYIKMQLHSIKYHSFDCIGVLIGKNQKIVDAIPLFHQRVLTGSLEVAMDMIENCYLEDGNQIMGVYEAAHSSTLGSKEISPLASYLCEQINSKLGYNGVFICIKPN